MRSARRSRPSSIVRRTPRVPPRRWGTGSRRWLLRRQDASGAGLLEHSGQAGPPGRRGPGRVARVMWSLVAPTVRAACPRQRTKARDSQARRSAILRCDPHHIAPSDEIAQAPGLRVRSQRKRWVDDGWVESRKAEPPARRDVPAGQSIHPGAPSEIRTRTGSGLSRTPLPIGLSGHAHRSTARLVRVPGAGPAWRRGPTLTTRLTR